MAVGAHRPGPSVPPLSHEVAGIDDVRRRVAEIETRLGRIETTLAQIVTLLERLDDRPGCGYSDGY